MSRELLDEIAEWNRRTPLTKEELSGFGRAPAEKPRVIPHLSVRTVKTRDGEKKLVPVIGVKVRI